MLDDATEIAAGLRHIQYEGEGSLVVSGRLIDAEKLDFDETIYSASVKHNFSDEIMGYVSYGSSWRPGLNVIGDFSLAKTPLESSFLLLPPETSDSIELGIKSSWQENRLRVNATVYHQTFDNYPYRAGDAGVFYVETSASNVVSVQDFNFTAAVPIIVDGVELEISFLATDQWKISSLISYAKGELDDATIPCNDYFPNDGVPDSSVVQPTLAQIRVASGGDNLVTWQANFSSSYAPEWTANLQSEYTFKVGPVDAYVRGLVSWFDDTENDPSNPIDDVDAYALLNLYAGLRSVEGKWEIMLYGKNIAETERVLSRNASPASVGYTALLTTTPPIITEGGSAVSTYREISMTAPREFGVNLRYSF